ncbi:MAG TPA: dTDP-4-dehydrorhamnose reductase [Thermoanaerobaculia bacterium]|nr:dTDP-4-dehydrorhamnose reductase [Thermoanaerobaculia bacterium]
MKAPFDSLMAEAGVAPAPVPVEVMAAPQPAGQLKKRVLVTGSSGMLGRDVVPVLAGAGCEVFARPHAELDITSADQVDRTLREIRPDIVVNCAAQTRVDACETEPRAAEVNAGGVRLLANACRRQGCQLVQISTDFVFAGDKAAPYLEADRTGPLSAYGRGKLEGEEAALSVPTGLVVRSSWLFGRGGWNFVEAILEQVESGKRALTVVNDQRGRPTATIDLAEAVLALLEAGAVGVFHFANGGEATWFDFAQDILLLSGHGDVALRPTTSEELARPARRPAFSVLATEKYEKVTGREIRHYREPLIEYLAVRAEPEL